MYFPIQYGQHLRLGTCRTDGGFGSTALGALAILAAFFGTVMIPAGRGTGTDLWTYQGQIAPDNAEDEGIRKSFEIHALWEAGDPAAVVWVLDDEDPRAMDWSERFGRASAAMGASAGVAGPVLRLEWEGGRYQLPVLLIAPDAHDPLRVGRQWEAEGLEHEVAEELRRGGQSAYLVQVRSPIGWKRQVVRPATTRRVVELSERFFVGQGKRHLLQLRVTRQEPVDAAQHAAWLQAFDQLHRLRPNAVDGSAETPALSAEKSAELRDRLTRLTSSAPTPWQHLVQTALQQLQQAQTRQAGLEFVRRQALEKTLPELQIESVRGTAPARDQLANRVVVLHFWDYRDAPLHEPYGQVGYLDFLYRKYADQGVVVLGVVTNQQSESPGGRRTAAVGARKFASFMNLAYPVVQDGGALLRYVGDPRLHDGALPLFVVVDRSGKIIHYWSGYYPVDTQRGLVELEGVIRQALQTAP